MRKKGLFSFSEKAIIEACFRARHRTLLLLVRGLSENAFYFVGIRFLDLINEFLMLINQNKRKE